MMKALLINGARSLLQYDLNVNALINFQGWGLVNITNTLPEGIATKGSGSGSLVYFDQDSATALATGLLFKLVLAPALILIFFAGLSGVEGQAMRVTIFEAAMPPMIGASIVAMNHELDPPFLTLMIGVGIPLSFLTLPAWWYLLTLV